MSEMHFANNPYLRAPASCTLCFFPLCFVPKSICCFLGSCRSWLLTPNCVCLCRLFAAPGLPAWITQSTSENLLMTGASFACPTLTGLGAADDSFIVDLDATYFGYLNCSCLP